MNVAILTHPLVGNYGGMLQAFALQKSIEKLNHTAAVIETEWRSSMRSQFKRLIRRSLQCIVCTLQGKAADDMATRFKKRSIPTVTTRWWEGSSLPFPDAFVVGSDQVWRALYVRNIISLPAYFLDFVPASVRKKSISYAASFGTDKWEGTPEETATCATLLQEFKAVSVREHSGIAICRGHLGANALQMPDPTLLLTLDDYDALIRSEPTSPPKYPYIATYILDMNSELDSLLCQLEDELQLPLHPLMPQARAPRREDRIRKSVPQWLASMRAADYVITDSFHGCVFAIIFNKPFVCLGNKVRGSARFDSLLSTFHLESRLVYDHTEAAAVLSKTVDWDAVNFIHEQERQRGLDFLRSNLS